MAGLIPVGLVLGGMLLVFRIGTWLFNPDRGQAAIVVVDRRTLRIAHRRVAEAEEAGDLIWAYAGAVAATLWLRDRVRSGPRRLRVRRARELEAWELRAEQLRGTVTAGRTVQD